MSGEGTRPPEGCVQYETNVDDLDPRVWPAVLDRLLEVGAHDAWLTPILMKKGRPAFTLKVLCDLDAAASVREAIFRETSTLGVRELAVRKFVLARDQDVVDVGGRPVRVKRALLGDEEVNRSVEWDDVALAASELGMTAKEVLAAATAAAHRAKGGT